MHRDGHGFVRVITAHVSYERLIERAFEKIRQAGRGMPAVLMRQLEALTRIMTETTTAEQRELLLEQAAHDLPGGRGVDPRARRPRGRARRYTRLLAAAAAGVTERERRADRVD